MNLRIGSRGSQLALWQAHHIATLLREQGHSVEIEIIKTTGDKLQEVTFARYRLKAYQQTVQNFIQRLREYCRPRGVHFFSVSSDVSLENLLLKQLREAEIWG